MLATTIQITNNPPHTPTPTPTGWPAAQATTTTSGGRSHGVEREPDSVLECHKTFMPNPQSRTHTHHPHQVAYTCRHKKTTQHTNHKATMLHCSPQNGLPRKEVIQPHLPVRLPCYDFVPIANPTFDHSPHTKRLGHGLRVLPTFVT